MSQVQVQGTGRMVIPASEWQRLLSQGPTDVQVLPGGVLLVFPDSWTVNEVIAVLGASSGGGSVPPGVPPG